MIQMMIGAAAGLLLAVTAAATAFVAVSPEVAAMTTEIDE
jgi:septum formation inhibitor-activating ATPase MinD